MNNSKYDAFKKETGEKIELKDNQRVIIVEEGDTLTKYNSRKSYLSNQQNFDNNFNKGVPFMKLFLNYADKLKEMELSDSAMIFILYIAKYLDNDTNMVLNEKDKPATNKDLAEIIGKSTSTIALVLSELKDKNLIAIKGKARGRKIYLNPYLISYGSKQSKEIIKMFSPIK